jgi:hypothetical protein
MNPKGKWSHWTTVAVLAGAVIAAMVASATAKTKIRQTLHATAHAPNASGLAKLALRTGSSGKFTIKARHLPRGKSFDIVVNKVKVGTLVTGPGGSGVARFSTSPKGRATMLGFDPKGAQIAIRDEGGDDDLEGNIPDDNPDSAMGCCLGEHDDGEAECEDMTATECAGHGGTPTTAAGCLPNPCGTNPPPTTVVCCRGSSAGGAFVDDDPEVECEDDVSQSECAHEGGIVVQASSCDPNPCQPAPPPDLVICCVPDGDEAECEHLTRDHCTGANGTVSTATSCDPDPCGAGGDGGDGGDTSDGGGDAGD